MKENFELREDKFETKDYGLIFLFFINLISVLAAIKNFILIKVVRMDKEKVRSGSYGSFLVDFFSKFNRNIRLNAASWKALDSLYNYEKKVEEAPFIERFVSGIWVKTNNAQAARNRAKIVKQLIKDEIAKIISRNSDKGTIRILSIASGSAQPLLEALASFDEDCKKRLEIHLLDLDKSALENSSSLAKKLGLGDCVQTHHNSASDVIDLFREEYFNLVEMVGFLDYRPHDRAVALIKNIRKISAKGAVFVTCNIYPNKEKFFLDQVLLWPMIYRNKDEFSSIIKESGYDEDSFYTFLEPFRIHQMAVCFKK